MRRFAKLHLQEMAYILSNKVIPTFHKGLIEGQFAYEKLTVEAYLEGSYQKALQALTLNRTIVSAGKAREVLDALIEANKEYWPELN